MLNNGKVESTNKPYTILQLRTLLSLATLSDLRGCKTKLWTLNCTIGELHVLNEMHGLFFFFCVGAPSSLYKHHTILKRKQ